MEVELPKKEFPILFDDVEYSLRLRKSGKIFRQIDKNKMIFHNSSSKTILYILSAELPSL